MGRQAKLFQLLVAHFDFGVVPVGVQGGLDGQTRLCGGAGNQVDNRLMADQGGSAPVLSNETEEPVLDLVPLARTRWEVADMEAQAQLVGERLQ